MTPAFLKAYRVEHQLCQGSLAKLLGIARTTLNGYERGNAPIPLMMSLALAALHLAVRAYAPCEKVLSRVLAGSIRRIADAGAPLAVDGSAKSFTPTLPQADSTTALG